MKKFKIMIRILFVICLIIIANLMLLYFFSKRLDNKYIKINNINFPKPLTINEIFDSGWLDIPIFTIMLYEKKDTTELITLLKPIEISEIKTQLKKYYNGLTGEQKSIFNDLFPMYDVILNKDNYYRFDDTGNSIHILIFDQNEMKLYYFSMRKRFYENIDSY